MHNSQEDELCSSFRMASPYYLNCSQTILLFCLSLPYVYSIENALNPSKVSTDDLRSDGKKSFFTTFDPERQDEKYEDQLVSL